MSSSFLLMMMKMMVLGFITCNVNGNTFIWDPNNTDNIELVRPFSRHSTFSNPPKCVPIPVNLTLCHGIKYNEMRLPNLLYHETMNEVIEQSNSWIQLIKIGCHSDTQLFLCSLFSPVCLDQTIPPCRSLCENVKQSCEPSMLKHGFNWPPMMQCNLFPIENNMCIESQVMNSMDKQHSTQKQLDQQSTIKTVSTGTNNQNEKENSQFQKQLIDAICNSDWVIKVGLNHIRDNNQVRVKKFKTIYGNLNVPTPFTLILNKSVIINRDANNTFTSATITTGIKPNREKFVIIGRGNNQKNLSAHLVVSWLKNTVQIKKALRRAKNNVECKKYLTSLLNTNSSNTKTNSGLKRTRNRNRKKNHNLAMIH